MEVNPRLRSSPFLKFLLLALLVVVAYLFIHNWNNYGNNVMKPNWKTHMYSEPNVTSTFLIPGDEELSKLDESKLRQVYWRYINTLQVLCRNQLRLGSMQDGGKEVCLDPNYIPTKPCLVYSFGCNWQFDFDLEVVRRFGCEVHVFDPSMDLRKGKIPPEVTFHLEGLSGKTETRKNGWKIKTLKDFMQSLSHEDKILDILKIDIEGDEWPSLIDIVASGAYRNVKQILVELHYDMYTMKVPQDRVTMLRGLYKAGFRLFMHERIKWLMKDYPGIGTFTPIIEISLLNMKFYSS